MTIGRVEPENEICHPAIIRGLLRELSILRMPVSVEYAGKTEIVTLRIISDAGRSKSEAMLLALEPAQDNCESGTIRFDFDGAFYSGMIQKDQANPIHYVIPERLKAIGRRRHRRHKTQFLTATPLVAEVSRPGFREIGVLSEYDLDHLVIEWVTPPQPLPPESHTRIRVFDRRKEVLVSEATVKAAREIGGKAQTIFRIDTNSNQPEALTRSDRARLDHPARLTFSWPDDTGLKLQLQVEVAGQFGFSARIIDGALESPPVGSIGQLVELGIQGRIAWKSDAHLGMDLRPNPRLLLGRWLQTLDRWTRASLLALPERGVQKSLLSMMIRSSYLKGKRTEPFKAGLPARELIPLEDHSYSWLKRISYVRTSEAVDTHISYVRTSDHSWLIQELGSAASIAGLGLEVLTSSIRELYFQEEPYLKPWSHLLAVYDPQSKFNQQFWESRSHLPGVFCTPTCVFELRPLLADTPKTIPNIALQEPRLEYWPEQFEVLRSRFSSRLLYSLGLGADSYSNEALTESLASSGVTLRRKALLILENNVVQGFIVQLGLPPFSNLTGLTEALWIGLPEKLSMPLLISHLQTTAEGRAILTGATDALVYSQNSEHVLPEPGGEFRRFKTQCISQAMMLKFLEGAPE